MKRTLTIIPGEWTPSERVEMHLEAIATVRKEMQEAKATGDLRAYRDAGARLMDLEHCLASEIRHQIDKAA